MGWREPERGTPLSITLHYENYDERKPEDDGDHLPDDCDLRGAHEQLRTGNGVLLMEHAALKLKLLYSPREGVFRWIEPPKFHSELLGEAAGCEAMMNGKPYHVIQIDDKKWKRSHLAFLYMTGSLPDSDVVDHINGISTDDRWSNLRTASFTQNAQNRKIGRPGRELPIGVRMVRSGKYCARITVLGKQISLGSFETVEMAKQSYEDARVKYYGEYA